jgi:hypothetical protein
MTMSDHEDPPYSDGDAVAAVESQSKVQANVDKLDGNDAADLDGPHIEAKSLPGDSATETATWTTSFGSVPVVEHSIAHTGTSNSNVQTIMESKSTTAGSIQSVYNDSGATWYSTARPKDVMAMEET